MDVKYHLQMLSIEKVLQVQGGCRTTHNDESVQNEYNYDCRVYFFALPNCWFPRLMQYDIQMS